MASASEAYPANWVPGTPETPPSDNRMRRDARAALAALFNSLWKQSAGTGFDARLFKDRAAEDLGVPGSDLAQWLQAASTSGWLTEKSGKLFAGGRVDLI